MTDKEAAEAAAMHANDRRVRMYNAFHGITRLESDSRKVVLQAIAKNKPQLIERWLAEYERQLRECIGGPR